MDYCPLNPAFCGIALLGLWNIASGLVYASSDLTPNPGPSKKHSMCSAAFVYNRILIFSSCGHIRATDWHTTAPINHTRPSPSKLSPDGAARARKQTSDYSLLLSLSTSKGWKAESTWSAGYIPKWSAASGSRTRTRHPSQYYSGTNIRRVAIPAPFVAQGCHDLEFDSHIYTYVHNVHTSHYNNSILIQWAICNI